MKAYAIVLPEAQQQFEELFESSKSVGNKFPIWWWAAVEPPYVAEAMATLKLKWNWPWNHSVYDSETELMKHPYNTAIKEKRIGCFLSHYMLWQRCVTEKEPLLILEQDARFVKKLDIDLVNNDFGAIGINNPIGATRKASQYNSITERNGPGIHRVPRVDNDEIPQGLAGHSAYYIKPWFARKMLKAVRKYGAWPNDAIMCDQLFSGELGQTYPYFTVVKSGKSTTAT